MVHRDHPRVCGETVCCLICQLYAVGSPPRMRGNASAPGLRRWYARITPAYAGKRLDFLRPLHCCRDHPRVCGETLWAFAAQQPHPGSPPRMRGNAMSSGR